MADDIGQGDTLNTTASSADSVRVSFHHIPVKEGNQIRLHRDETVMSVEWDSDTDYFHVIVMHAQIDGGES